MTSASPRTLKSKKPKKSSAKAAKVKATKLHSLIVRARGACEHCGATSNLQCAHIVSRRYSATRTDLTNAVCLDAKCHMHFTEWPLEFGLFVNDHIGQSAYEALKRKAEASAPVDWPAEAQRLELVWKSVQSEPSSMTAQTAVS